MEGSSPYVGPRAFAQDERLYGRDRERRDLLDVLIAERVVLLYSPSGAGKTSLIQAGLIPQLQTEDFSVLPIVRVGRQPPLGYTKNRYIYSVAGSLGEVLPAELQETSASSDLCSYLSAAYRDRGPRTVLVLDQFEEIFTADQTDVEQREMFFRQLGASFRDPDLWVLLAMREDYIANLDPYISGLPTRLSKRYRLDLLGPDAAVAAIVRPAAAAGVTFEEEAARKLVDNLRQVGPVKDGAHQLGPHVEPVHLQIACLQLWERMKRKWEDSGEGTAGQRIDAGEISEAADVDAALADYYQAKVAAIAANGLEPEAALLQERKIREWFEQSLITPEGIRSQQLKGSAESASIGDDAIEQLIDAYLIRIDERRNATWYELAHDRLVHPVRANNAEWFRLHSSWFRPQAELWRASNDRELLFTGSTLDDANHWAELHPDQIGSPERGFLEASRKARVEARWSKRVHLYSRAAAALVLLSVATTAGVYYDAYHERVQHQLQLERANGALDVVTERLAQVKETGRRAMARERLRGRYSERIFERRRQEQELSLQGLQALGQGLRNRNRQLQADAARFHRKLRDLETAIVFAAARAPESPQLAQLLEVVRGSGTLPVTDLQRAMMTNNVRTRAAQPGPAARARADNDNRWGMRLWANHSVLRVRFMNGDEGLRAQVFQIASEWTDGTGIRFVRSDAPDAEVRVRFDSERLTFSSIGTDSLGVPLDQPTVILGALRRPGRDMRHAVLHEFGHVLGLIHEHQNPNARLPWNIVALYLVLPPDYIQRELTGDTGVRSYRDFDPHSVMLYKQYADSMFLGDVRLSGGSHLSPSDRAFIRELYPARAEALFGGAHGAVISERHGVRA